MVCCTGVGYGGHADSLHFDTVWVLHQTRLRYKTASLQRRLLLWWHRLRHLHNCGTPLAGCAITHRTGLRAKGPTLRTMALRTQFDKSLQFGLSRKTLSMR